MSSRLQCMSLKEIFFLLLLMLASSELFAEERYALVIGNSAYKENPLSNPVKDAELIGSRLEQLGFEVQYIINANQVQMLDEIGKFETRLKITKNATTFAYYAGHGVQVDGENFLLPVDFSGQSEGDTKRRAVNANILIVFLLYLSAH